MENKKEFIPSEQHLVWQIKSQLISLNNLLSYTDCPVRLTLDRETIGDWSIYFQLNLDDIGETTL